jgi:hypothetical protein
MHDVVATRTTEGVRLLCRACSRSESILAHEFDRFNGFIDAHCRCAEGMVA